MLVPHYIMCTVPSRINIRDNKADGCTALPTWCRPIELLRWTCQWWPLVGSRGACTESGLVSVLTSAGTEWERMLFVQWLWFRKWIFCGCVRTIFIYRLSVEEPQQNRTFWNSVLLALLLAEGSENRFLAWQSKYQDVCTFLRRISPPQKCECGKKLSSRRFNQ